MHQGNIDSIVVMEIQRNRNKTSETAANDSGEILYLWLANKPACVTSWNWTELMHSYWHLLLCVLQTRSLFKIRTLFTTNTWKNIKKWKKKIREDLNYYPNNNWGKPRSPWLHWCCRPVVGTYGRLQPEPFQLGRGCSPQHLGPAPRRLLKTSGGEDNIYSRAR